MGPAPDKLSQNCGVSLRRQGFQTPFIHPHPCPLPCFSKYGPWPSTTGLEAYLPRSLFEIPSLRPASDLLNHNLHLIIIPRALISTIGPAEDGSHRTQISPLLGPALYGETSLWVKVPGLANKNRRCRIKFAFQISDKRFFFSISMSCDYLEYTH